MLLVAAAVSGLATVASSAAAGELLPHGDFSATVTPTGAMPTNWTVVCAAGRSHMLRVRALFGRKLTNQLS